LYLTYPTAGVPGLCAVVPEGKPKYPVDVFAWSETEVGVADTVAQVWSPRK
jgi:hypothetical protein